MPKAIKKPLPKKGGKGNPKPVKKPKKGY